MTNPTEIDFATVLACSVHDMKNSLCMVIQSAELIQAEGSKLSNDARDELALLNYEANRLNSNLLQLLSLYRLDRQQLPVQIDQHYLNEVFEELLLKNQYFATQRNIEVIINSDSDLNWFFDRDLVMNVLNDAIANAMRYSSQRILLSAEVVDTMLHIVVADDGPGFPDFMLHNAAPDMHKLDLRHGHTGLGIFFAKLIARAHHNKSQRGMVSLQNDGVLNGGSFRLALP
ncbi:signal transduction histidine kinase [Arsukibacterium tuosuense]|uniref:Signal transduction histidine kinase n=1 Tax=Arsukibacterium tuosuense TaxID=1323745 RepID=A0A285J6G8_9GAMM|nr:ATP-binding protein [Arsukibacterium tuosuense]SNY55818.1 signal transduction histidine kinase [Arsukibacterium tuosuense]